MDISVSPVTKSSVECTVTIPPEEFEPHARRAASLFSEEREFGGFRKGKAPFDIVEKALGTQRIYERAADVAIRANYTRILDTALRDLEEKTGRRETPIGRPAVTITKLAPGNELQFKITLALFPTVTLPDYRRIAVDVLKREKKDIVVGDEDVGRAVDWLRESRATEVRAGRPAGQGDRADIDFDIRRGGILIENGSSKHHSLVIGKGNFIPGFEDALIGMTEGEKKTFTLSVPDTWRDAKLRGTSLDITVVVNEIYVRTVPELTDEFAGRVGTFETKEKLVESVREGLFKERRGKEKERIRMQIIEDIARKAAIDVPDLLIESELDKMLAELKSGISSMGMKWEDYLLHIKKTSDDLRRGWLPEGEKRVRIALALKEIAEKEHIAPTDAEIQMKADEYLSRFKGAADAEKDIDPETLREYTKGVLKNEKVFEFLESINE